MKIWFDLTNSPHIHFFREMIAELKREGHEVLVTSRDAANTVDLMEMYHIDYHLVGGFYGTKLSHKIMGNIKRVRDLARFVKEQGVDVGISQSSFAAAVAARLAHVPCIYTNDNEHAMGNKVSFIFANQIFVPEFIPVSKVANLFVSKRKVQQYPGVKEGIYLWRKYLKNQQQDSHKATIYYRPEPYFAQYYKGKTNFFDDALVELKDDYSIVILPRDKQQAAHYQDSRFNGITVSTKPLEFDQIANDCMLFIGAGGTMTREMAVIGIPTISVYQDELLDVDRYLIAQGLMDHNPDLTAADVRAVINKHAAREADQSLLQKGKDAYEMIKNKLLSLK
ncbi:MAG: DUF354 domain-containing protein [Muribaculaceae bacterium]|nr:DUF354 domain-containing protein [Muribaculaceae bacterium]